MKATAVSIGAKFIFLRCKGQFVHLSASGDFRKRYNEAGSNGRLNFDNRASFAAWQPTYGQTSVAGHAPCDRQIMGGKYYALYIVYFRLVSLSQLFSELTFVSAVVNTTEHKCLTRAVNMWLRNWILSVTKYYSLRWQAVFGGRSLK